MKFNTVMTSILALATVSFSGSGHAADLTPAPAATTQAPDFHRWYVDVGGAWIGFATAGKFTVGGAPLPGSAKIPPVGTVGIGAGYFITKDISVHLLGGYPPEINLIGKGGAVDGLLAGRATGAPALLTLDYHFNQFGAFQPFVGAGLSYLIVFSTKDAALSDEKVDNHFGSGIRAGFDYMLNDHWGLTASAQKVFVSTNGTASLGGAPVLTKVRLDPTVVMAGITYRF